MKYLFMTYVLPLGIFFDAWCPLNKTCQTFRCNNEDIGQAENHRKGHISNLTHKEKYKTNVNLAYMLNNSNFSSTVGVLKFRRKSPYSVMSRLSFSPPLNKEEKNAN